MNSIPKKAQPIPRPQRNITYVLVFLILLCIVYTLVFNYKIGRSMDQSFQSTFLKKELYSSNLMDRLLQEKSKKNLRNYILSNQVSLQAEADKEDLTIFIQDSSKLAYWTDHTQDIPFTIDRYQSQNLKYINFKNNCYVYHSRTIKTLTIYSFILIKNIYPSKNWFFDENFAKDFHVSDHSTVSDQFNPHAKAIHDHLGNTVLYFSPEVGAVAGLSNIQLGLYGITYLVFMLFLIFVLRWISNQYGKKTFIFCAIFMALTLSITFYLLPKHTIFYSHILFSPKLFAAYWWMPSLGHLLVYTINLTMLICALCYVFVRVENQSKTTLVVVYSLNALLFIAYLYTIALLCNNSSLPIDFKYVSFLDYKIHFYYAIISLLAFCYSINSFFTFEMSRNFKRHEKLLTQLLTVALTFCITFFVLHYPWWTVLFHFSILFCSGYLIQKRNLELPFIINPRAVLIILILQSVGVNLIINHFNQPILESYIQTKMSNLNEVLPNKSNVWEEFLLVDLSSQIQDAVNKSNLLNEKSQIKLQSEIKTFFQSSDWERYKINIYFENIDSSKTSRSNVSNAGENLDNSNFTHKIDQTSDNYEGVFQSELKNVPIQLRITLVSERGNAENDGYSNIFNNQLVQSNIGKQLSFARYKKGKLTISSGSYTYNENDLWLTRLIGENHNSGNSISYNNYEHWYFHSSNNQLLVVSFPGNTTNSLFVINTFTTVAFIVFLMFITLVSLSLGWIYMHQSFSTRMSISFTLIFFIGITFLGFFTLKVIVNQYQSNDQGFLVQKSDNVLHAFLHNLQSISDFTYTSINPIAKNLSKEFNVDVNIYDNSGILMLSSQPAIFQHGLRSQLMSSYSRLRLGTAQNQQLLIQEKIGKLTFFSYYAPIHGPGDTIIGYFNIPYLYSFDRLNLSIYNLLAGIINIYMLLILTMSFFIVLISKRLTRPLTEIQRHIQQLELKAPNRQIKNQGKDEIGELIDEYNKMLITIEKQAIKLAESEREIAWRTMARQIAHEIKNPLTPMKLKIQQLQHLKQDQSAKFDSYFQLAAPVLIEQINSLASIADEFSDFAKTNDERQLEEVNMIDWIAQYIVIYDSNPDIKITYNSAPWSEIWCNIDRSRIRQVFNNIINNAIQAKGKHDQVVDHISVSIDGTKMRISLSNNGTKIPDEIQNKIFNPNFTTKSSGMGLGLPISKRIINQWGGEIWFESSEKCTTFFIELNYTRYRKN